MTRRTVRIDRLVLRGTAVELRHADRLRGLVHDESTGLLEDGGRTHEVAGRVPAARGPEEHAGPLARRIAAEVPRQASP